VNTVRNINTNITFVLYFCLYCARLGSLLANKLILNLGKGSKIKAHVNKQKKNTMEVVCILMFIFMWQTGKSDTNKTITSVKRFGKKARTGRLICYIQEIYAGYTQYMSVARTLYQRI